MFRKVLFLTVSVLGLLACELQAGLVNSKWVGSERGEWGNKNNWDPRVVPDNNPFNTFAVTIDSNSIGLDEIEVSLKQNRTITRLSTSGVVELVRAEDSDDGFWLIIEDANGFENLGALTIQDDLWIHGDIVNYGKLKISCQAEVEGNIMNNGYMKTSDGVEILGNVTNSAGATAIVLDPDVGGTLYNAAGASLRILDNVEVHEDNEGNRGDLENAGLIIVELAGDLWAEQQFHNTGQIELMGGSLGRFVPEKGQQVVDNNSPGAIAGFGIVKARQLIQNKGTICASEGPLLVESKRSVTNTGTLMNEVGAALHIRASIVDVNNQHIIEINDAGAVTFNGYLNNEPNAIIDLRGGTLSAQRMTQMEGAKFEGFGGITGNVLIDPNAVIKLTGPTNIVGDVTISQNATLEISDGTTLITGQTTCNGTIHMKGGRIIPQGGLSGNCNIIWEPGTYSNIADFNLDGRVNFKDLTDFADTWLWVRE